MKIALLVCVLALLLTVPRGARAQSINGNSTTITCDDAEYPRLRCDVALPGGPAAETLSVSFENAGIYATPSSVRQLGDPAVRGSVLLLLDYGLHQRRTYGKAHAEAIAAALDSARPEDQLAVLTLPRAPGTSEGVAEPRFDLNQADIRAQLRGLVPVAAAPLHDGVCQALRLLSQEPGPARMLVIVSDGRDAGSSACAPEDAIALARAQRIAVLALLVGPQTEHAFLKRLAFATHGAALAGPDLSQTTERWKQTLALQKTRYQFDVTVSGPHDNQVHTGLVRISAGAETLQRLITYTASPAVPLIEAPQLRHNSDEIAAALLPADSLILIEPRVLAQRVTRVDYEINGRTETVTRAPFTSTLSTSSIRADVPTTLLIRAYGDTSQPARIAERSVLLAIAGTAASEQLMPTVRENNRMAVARKVPQLPLMAVVGGLTVLMLIAAAWISQRARMPMPQARHAARSRRNPAFQPVNATVENVKTHLHARINERNATARFAKPTVRDHSVLRITQGAESGREIAINAHAPVTIGRDPGADAVRIEGSAFLSGKHALFEMLLDGGLQVTDLRSVNGTQVNGKMLAPGVAHTLQPGDTVVCADVTLQVTKPHHAT